MQLRGELKIILGASLFALIPVGLKIDPSSGLCSLLFGRLFVASIVLFVANRKSTTFLKLNRIEFVHLTVWAVLMLVAMLLYFYSITSVGVAVSSALLGVHPLVLVLMSFFLVGEKITFQTLIACTLTLIGIVCISDLSALNDETQILGQSSAILSAITLGCVFWYQRKYLLRIGSQKATFFQCLLQLPFLIPLMFIDPPEVTINYLVASLLLGVGCTVFAYGLIYSGVKNVSLQKIGVLQSIEYVIPVFFGLFFFKEDLSWVAILGAAVIFIACIIVDVPLKRNESSGR